MVIRNDEEETKPVKKKKTKSVKVEEEEEEEINSDENEENKIPMIPNYLDLILGELLAIRLLLESQKK